ncbi:MAG: N-acetylmuramoyl-L-alanine amidase [Phycisphaerae bacterium]|nr:N-acetylmuramoyl-L-alanine amidase [Phycisphaerae bacterium]
MRKTVSLILSSIFVIFAAAGCQQPAQRTGGKPSLAGEEMVNVYYLAGKLGMTVSLTSKDKITFNDGINTVTILTKQDQVFVNNDYLSPLGKTKVVDDLLNVRGSLEDEIKSKLGKPAIEKPASIVPKPQKPAKKPFTNLSGKTVVIDAGHGGKDPGATSTYGYEEKTVNLDVALQIAQILRDKGLKVVMTRNNDEFIELEERADIANRNWADIFVSIHSDSSAKSSNKGFTLYIRRNGSSASASLANAIDRRMAKTDINGNGVSRADYRVLTHTSCPAVLVELGYLSNYWEAKQLKNKDKQRQLAQAITDGIIDYITK